MAPECRLPGWSPGLALGPPRLSNARKSIRFGLLPAPVIHPLGRPALSLPCQAAEPSPHGIMTYQPERGLLNLVKNIDSWAPPRTHESESPGVGPGNLDRRAQSRGNTGSFNPFIFQLKKLGFREESVLQGGSESLGPEKPSLDPYLGHSCCPFPALAPSTALPSPGPSPSP